MKMTPIKWRPYEPLAAERLNLIWEHLISPTGNVPGFLTCEDLRAMILEIKKAREAADA